jgi:hypothetical protein
VQGNFSSFLFFGAFFFGAGLSLVQGNFSSFWTKLLVSFLRTPQYATKKDDPQ